tara:strand:+ start:4397 stop:4990 length:594 start_codon:yes stop_codon:yes gene_type:complete
MCFSFEVSITTFLVSWGISIYLLQQDLTNEQYHNVIFLMIFSSMQLVDAILWATDMKKDWINYFVTSFLIPFILSLQIIYNIFFINQINNIGAYIFIFFICLFLFYVFHGYSKKSCNSLGSPQWGSLNLSHIQMLCFAFLITYGRIGFNGEKLAFLIIIFLSLFSSWFFSSGIGSLWCAFANILSFYYLIKYNDSTK